jgi:hypothetical protein
VKIPVLRKLPPHVSPATGQRHGTFSLRCKGTVCRIAIALDGVGEVYGMMLSRHAADRLTTSNSMRVKARFGFM